jgi:hydrogenase expression/formation protein HypC
MKKGKPLELIERGSYDVACSLIDGCLTCGDVAVPVTVIEVNGPDALCEDATGQHANVGIELVGPVNSGSRLLVHAGVAISILEESA